MNHQQRKQEIQYKNKRIKECLREIEGLHADILDLHQSFTPQQILDRGYIMRDGIPINGVYVFMKTVENKQCRIIHLDCEYGKLTTKIKQTLQTSPFSSFQTLTRHIIDEEDLEQYEKTGL